MAAAVASAVDPWFVNLVLLPNEVRYALSAVFGRSPSDPIAAETGVIPGGNTSGGPFTPTSNGTAGAPRVSVAPGHCIVATAAGGSYVCTWPAAANYSLTAPAGNPRIDVLCGRVQDNDVDASGVKQFQMITVDGTPASSPSAPSIPAGYLPLYNIQVATNGTLTITDRRVYTRAAGGIRVAPSTDLARAGSYAGDLRIQANGQIDVYLGSAWVTVANPAVWTAWTPSLTCPASGTNPALGSTGQAIGRYLLTGKMLALSYYFTWGGTGVSGGVDYIQTALPPGFVSRATAPQEIVNFFLTATAGKAYTGSCYIPPNSSILQPRFSRGATDASLDLWKAWTSAGANGTGVPAVPGAASIDVGASCTIHGVIEVQ